MQNCSADLTTDMPLGNWTAWSQNALTGRIAAAGLKDWVQVKKKSHLALVRVKEASVLSQAMREPH